MTPSDPGASEIWLISTDTRKIAPSRRSILPNFSHPARRHNLTKTNHGRFCSSSWIVALLVNQCGSWPASWLCIGAVATIFPCGVSKMLFWV